MPFVAIHADSGELNFTKQAEPEDDYLCAECEARAEYVRSHKREPNGASTYRVRSHFRRSNCDCGFGDGSAAHEGGGGGGGGAAESTIHKRRKLAAMHEATTRFDCSDFSTERYIGEKRADAVVVFEDPHEKYGKGLVIEYQHKNEGKDIEETQEHFARNEYTTVWLWEDQFSFPGEIPEIDLFGGEVYTPWPDAVPTVDRWSGLGLDHEKREKWERAYQDGLTNSSVPASFPRHFFLPTQKEFWRARSFEHIGEFMTGSSWENRFDPPEELLLDWNYSEIPAKIPSEHFDQEAQSIYRELPWSDLFREPDGEYPHNRHTVRGLVSELPTTEPPQPELVGKWYLPERADLWRETDWYSRFTVDTTRKYIREGRQEMGLPAGKVDVKLTEQITGKIKRDLRRKNFNPNFERPSNPFDDVQCWSCGTYWHVSAGHIECPSCGEAVDFEWNVQTERIGKKPDYAKG